MQYSLKEAPKKRFVSVSVDLCYTSVDVSAAILLCLTVIAQVTAEN